MEAICSRRWSISFWGFLKRWGRWGPGVKEDFAVTRPLQRGCRHCTYVRQRVLNKEGGGSLNLRRGCKSAQWTEGSVVGATVCALELFGQIRSFGEQHDLNKGLIFHPRKSWFSARSSSLSLAEHLRCSHDITHYKFTSSWPAQLWFQYGLNKQNRRHLDFLRTKTWCGKHWRIYLILF